MALQIMAPGTAIATELALVGTLAREMGHRLGAALAERAPGIFDPYRPELHSPNMTRALQSALLSTFCIASNISSRRTRSSGHRAASPERAN
jgi:hypothetical protein